MIPHEQYPPPKRPRDTQLTFMDYLMIVMTTVGIYTSFMVVSYLNMILCVVAWRMWERHRSGEYE